MSRSSTTTTICAGLACNAVFRLSGTSPTAPKTRRSTTPNSSFSTASIFLRARVVAATHNVMGGVHAQAHRLPRHRDRRSKICYFLRTLSPALRTVHQRQVPRHGAQQVEKVSADRPTDRPMEAGRHGHNSSVALRAGGSLRLPLGQGLEKTCPLRGRYNCHFKGDGV